MSVSIAAPLPSAVTRAPYSGGSGPHRALVVGVRLAIGVALVFTAEASPGRSPAEAALGSASAVGALRPASGYGSLPVAFEVNRGQTDARAAFVARANGQTLFLTATEAVLALPGRPLGGPDAGERKPAPEPGESVIRIGFVGAEPQPRLHGLDRLTTAVNYFTGDDASAWQTDVETFARVRYEGLYPGIDAVFYGNHGALEYDFVVAPGSAAEAIRLRFSGGGSPRIDTDGELVLDVAGGQFRQRRPVAYQETGGERASVESRYAIRADGTVGFSVGRYDPRLPLVIDPLVFFRYSTYLGGSGDDNPWGIAVDAAGNAYVTGYTRSVDFPRSHSSFDRTCGTDGVCDGSPPRADAFVTKLDPTGTRIVYSTYLGGSGADGAFGIAVDGSGNAYLAGDTSSSNFPATANAFDRSYAGKGDGFVAKLSASGSALLYSGYIGGAEEDSASDVAVRTANGVTTVHVVGSSGSGGTRNVVVTKFDPTLNGRPSRIFSRTIGGSFEDEGKGIAVDAAGNIYVTGDSRSSDFPTTPGAFAPGCRKIDGQCYDSVFVTKLSPNGASVLYSTYLDGLRADFGNAIAVDRAGSAYVTGSTASSDFPVTPGAFDASLAGDTGGFVDAFVTRLDPAGSKLVYSTYLGGGANDFGESIAVDGAGNASITGPTGGGFPLRDALKTSLNTGCGAFGWATCSDAFLTRIRADGTALVYSTYLGGTGSERGTGVALDSAGNAYVTGLGSSTDLQTTPGAMDRSANGGGDGFVMKVAHDTRAPLVSAPLHRLVERVQLGEPSIPVTVSWSGTDGNGMGIARFELEHSIDGGSSWSPVTLASPLQRTITLRLPPDGTGTPAVRPLHRFRVRAIDRARNVTAWKVGETFSVKAHDEPDPGIAYSFGGRRGFPQPHWTSGAVPGAYGGSVKGSAVAGATATFTFTGRQVTWVTTASVDRGIAQVILDGVLVATVDLYASSPVPGWVAFSRSDLAPSVTHTLRITVTGDQNAKAQGARVDVDAFVRVP